MFALIVIFIPTTFTRFFSCGLASARIHNFKRGVIYFKYGEADSIVNCINQWHGGRKFLVVFMFISLIKIGNFTAYLFGL